MSTAPILRIARDVLTSALAITDLVGTRVYPGHAPRSAAMPYLVTRQASVDETYGLDGPSGLERAFVLVTAYVPTYEAAEALGIAVIDHLKAYSGQVQGRHVEVRRNSVDSVDWVEELSAVRRTMRFLFMIGPAA
jgi:hypothetical protein